MRLGNVSSGFTAAAAVSAAAAAHVHKRVITLPNLFDVNPVTAGFQASGDRWAFILAGLKLHFL